MEGNTGMVALILFFMAQLVLHTQLKHHSYADAVIKELCFFNVFGKSECSNKELLTVELKKSVDSSYNSRK